MFYTKVISYYRSTAKIWWITAFCYLLFLLMAWTVIVKIQVKKINLNQQSRNYVVEKLEVVNPLQYQDQLIEDVQKPLEFVINQDFDLAQVQVVTDPYLNLILKKNVAAKSLLIYPASRFQYNTKYHFSLRLRDSELVSTTFETGPIPSTYFDQIRENNEVMDFSEKEAIKRYTDNPQMSIEARLRLNAPIRQIGFTIDFSYETGLFIVKLDQTIEENRAKFDQWFSENGLKDKSNFLTL